MSLSLPPDMEALLYIGIAQALFAALMIILKVQKTTADRILAVWLVLIAGWLVTNYIKVFHPDYAMNSWLGGGLLLLTFGPNLYLYSKYRVHEKEKIKQRDYLHFLPAIITTILMIGFVDRSLPPAPLQYFEADGNLWYRILFLSVSAFMIIYYPWRNAQFLKEHRKNIDNHFSYHSDRISLDWLKYINIGFILTFVLTFGVVLSRKLFGLDVMPIYIIDLGLIFFAYSISFLGFRQPVIFNEHYRELLNATEKPVRTIPTPKTAEVRYEKSGLKENDADVHLKRIQDYMIVEKPYLNGDLTIQNLAQKLDIPRHHITQIINEMLKKNFYTFVNEYRLQEVKQKLVSDEFKSYSVLGIALDCGFNSKSSFNTFFKQQEGITPSEFRKNSSH
ncbi:MAG: AraC family transcriptional regulator [Bacteroidales bacterium]|nr:AraC family transcriptional regulator [Bacteroidales bacterium]